MYTARIKFFADIREKLNLHIRKKALSNIPSISVTPSIRAQSFPYHIGGALKPRETYFPKPSVACASAGNSKFRPSLRAGNLYAHRHCIYTYTHTYTCTGSSNKEIKKKKKRRDRREIGRSQPAHTLRWRRCCDGCSACCRPP